LLVFFLAGLTVLTRVDVKAGEHEALEVR